MQRQCRNIKKENPSLKSSDAGKPASNVTPKADLEISESSSTNIAAKTQNVKSEDGVCCICISKQ